MRCSFHLMILSSESFLCKNGNRSSKESSFDPNVQAIPTAWNCARVPSSTLNWPSLRPLYGKITHYVDRFLPFFWMISISWGFQIKYDVD